MWQCQRWRQVIAGTALAGINRILCTTAATQACCLAEGTYYLTNARLLFGFRGLQICSGRYSICASWFMKHMRIFFVKAYLCCISTAGVERGMRQTELSHCVVLPSCVWQ